MKGESARRVPAEKAATPTEIAATIEALTPADFVRLRQYACRRIRCLGAKAVERTGDDLLQTALAHLLHDARRWDRTKVGFMGFLFGAMKSISSNWAKVYDLAEDPIREADMMQEDPERRGTRPLDRVNSPRPNAEEQLFDREALGQIDKLFKDDDKAQMVLTAWQEGYDPAGVRELWDLSQNDYNTIVRRIRRTLEATGITPDRDRGGAYVQ